jgi:hypothetical protein
MPTPSNQRRRPQPRREHFRRRCRRYMSRLRRLPDARHNAKIIALRSEDTQRCIISSRHAIFILSRFHADFTLLFTFHAMLRVFTLMLMLLPPLSFTPHFIARRHRCRHARYFAITPLFFLPLR